MQVTHSGNEEKEKLEARVGIEPTHKGFAAPESMPPTLSNSTSDQHN